MDTTRFAKGQDAFSVLGLTAKTEFKTASSISFMLGRWSSRRTGFSGVGWIDVHHPCEGHVKTRIRVRIPTTFQEFEQMKSLIAVVFENLGIPADETYESSFFESGPSKGLLRHIDRNGFSDVICSYAPQINSNE